MTGGAAKAGGTTAEGNRRGIRFMVATSLVFAAQDGMSRHLAAEYSVMMVVMIRYWFFAGFVVLMAARAPGGLAAAVATRQPALQIFRGLLLAAQICLAIAGFVALGLVQSHAIFAIYPLLVAALSGPVLGERVGWRRWTAIGIGLAGVLVILQPGFAPLAPAHALPLAAALMFALYGLLTRLVSRQDAAGVSFFWTGTAGAAFMTAAGLWFWEPMAPADWGWMALLCVSGALGHYLLIRAYEAAEAGAVQPFAFLQLVFSSAIGIAVFGDLLTANIAAGAAIVVAAGLFTLWRARLRGQG